MATTKTTYTANGTNKLFAFTFPYFFPADIKVQLNGVNTTAYTFANATTIEMNAAPAAGVKVSIYRDTNSDQMNSEFYPGSAIRAQDLNDNYNQVLYVVQENETLADETDDKSDLAISTATGAVSTANVALSQSSAAVNTANTSSANATAAVATSNAASSASSSALSNSSTALNTANTALSTANSSATQAATALSQSTTALSQSTTALSQSSTAVASSSAAVSTANTANTNASSAVSTAGTASSNASTALSTANTANNKADQAISAVSNSINYTLIANVAGIPATPANDTYVEVGNSTGIESFTPLAGKPAGFVGDSGLSVRIRYTTAGATWNWQNYYPNNAETRYLKLAGGTLIGPLTLAGPPTSNLHPASKAYVDGYVSSINGDIGSLSSTKLDITAAASTYQTQSGMSSYLTTATAGSTYAPLASPTFTGTPVVPGYLTATSASSTYQTQAGMSSYVPTSGIGSTVQAYDANTAKTNVAQAFSKAQRGAVVALTSGATVTPDFSLANNYSLALGVNATLANPTNLTAGQSGVITITNGASYTLAYGSYWKFPGGTAPTLTVSGGTDALAYFVDSSTRITARLVSDVK